jgi:hypothetical protein
MFFDICSESNGLHWGAGLFPDKEVVPRVHLLLISCGLRVGGSHSTGVGPVGMVGCLLLCWGWAIETILALSLSTAKSTGVISIPLLRVLGMSLLTTVNLERLGALVPRSGVVPLPVTSMRRPYYWSRLAGMYYR